MFFARLWEINFHISTDYYHDYIHFHKNKQKNELTEIRIYGIPV